MGDTKNFNHVVDAAKGSFDSLWNDASNGANGDLEGGAEVEVYEILKDLDFKFKHIYLVKGKERSSGEFGLGKNLSEASGKDKALGEVPPATRGNKTVSSGRFFRNSFDWEIETSIWNPKHDDIRKSLHDMVKREQAEIFIESAYMDFDPQLEKHLEDALKRGVRVTIISNSVFTSDGASKLISFSRGQYINELLGKYADQFSWDFGANYYENARRQRPHDPNQKGRFDFYLTTPYTGHMTHFKGAGFKCQKGDDGSYYKTFIIGSHNFHRRSGVSDKEHALIWKEKIDLSCFDRHYSYTLDKNGEMIDGAKIKARAKKERGMDYDEIVKRHQKQKGGGYGLLSPANRDLIDHRIRFWSALNRTYQKHNKPILLALPSLRGRIKFNFFQ